MNIAVEGCSHGELDVIYAAVEHAQEMSGISIDLLICCGDFQAVRNPGDLRCMAAPLKYLHMQSFYKYYSGEKKAPMLTLFIGGNHEASNHLQELPYGGWVAPNIYYLGYGGVVHVGGLRIGGVSGIYKGVDYLKGRYERPPYTEISIRSVYHARNLEVFRMKQLDQSAGPLDIFLTHDWPRGITKFGDAEKLCRVKPFFTEEVEADALGSKSAQELLQHLQPRYWFSGHLHVKFVALVDHSQNSEDKQPGENSSSREIPRFTRFIALDKCLPRREFLQVLSIKCGQMHKYQNVKLESSSKPCNLEDVPKTNNSDQTGDENLPKVNSLPASNLYSYSAHDESGNLELHHDLEWLTVLRLTDHLLKVTPYAVYMPGPGSSERYDFTPTQDDLLETLRLMGDDLRIHTAQFRRTAQAFHPERDALLIEHLDTVPQPEPVLHPHTQELCERLRIRDPMAELLKGAPGRSPFVAGTPRGAALLSEVDVTLDASRLTYADEGNASDGDIVFEVSISDNTDGTSEGVLSPAITPTRPSTRRLLQGSPVRVSSRGCDSHGPDYVTQESSTADTSSQSSDASSPPRRKRTSLSLTSPRYTSPDLVLTTVSTGVADTIDVADTGDVTDTGDVADAVINGADTVGNVPDGADTVGNVPDGADTVGNVADTGGNVPDAVINVPDGADAVGDGTDIANAVDRLDSADVSGVDRSDKKMALKPSKIRRRNAALYVNDDV